MEASGGIRQSAYEPGLFFVPAEPGTTLQDHSTQWQVRGPQLGTSGGMEAAAWRHGDCRSLPAAHTFSSHPHTTPQVGSRYTLLRVLGYGSYSAVCLAVDNETGEKVGRSQSMGIAVGRRGRSGAGCARCCWLLPSKLLTPSLLLIWLRCRWR